MLYAQGKEEVIRYTVGAGGEVSAESVLRFPPSWGSSSLKLVDFDGDGVRDLLYTCGDGADYISDPKPYHGIRLFRGAADGTYAETRFWPLAGAYDAELGDFDGDGDVDLAAISFFPDYRQAEPHAAVLFENDGSELAAAPTTRCRPRALHPPRRGGRQRRRPARPRGHDPSHGARPGQWPARGLGAAGAAVGDVGGAVDRGWLVGWLRLGA